MCSSTVAFVPLLQSSLGQCCGIFQWNNNLWHHLRSCCLKPVESKQSALGQFYYVEFFSETIIYEYFTDIFSQVQFTTKKFVTKICVPPLLPSLPCCNHLSGSSVEFFSEMIIYEYFQTSFLRCSSRQRNLSLKYVFLNCCLRSPAAIISRAVLWNFSVK